MDNSTNIPVCKNWDTEDCKNYRGITLPPSNKIRHLIEPHMDKAQSGFRPGRSVQDHIFTIEQTH